MKSASKLALVATLLSGCAAVNEPTRDDATQIARLCLSSSRGGTVIETYATPLLHPSQCVVVEVNPGGWGRGQLHGLPCSEVGRWLREDGMGLEFSNALTAESISVEGPTTFVVDYLRTPHPVTQDVVVDFGEGRIFRVVGEGVATLESCLITPTGL